MTQPTTPFQIPRKVQEAIVRYQNECFRMIHQQWNIREQMRKIDLRYARENDYTDDNITARSLNHIGDPTKMQNVTVPVIYPAVESAVTYQSSVFLTGTPIFGVVSSPENQDAAMQMEAVIEDQQIKGGWVRELMLFFRDGFKYNLSAIEVSWDRVITAELETDLTKSRTEAIPKETIWTGNKLRRLDPYNVFFDSRVPPTEIHKKGEFAGWTEIMSRIELKALIARLPDKMTENIKEAFQSGLGSSGNTSGTYYFPRINPEAILSRDPRFTTNWMAWAGLAPNYGANGNSIEYKDVYEVSTIYGRILPSDFGLRVPSPNTPQIWKFIIVNNAVMIYAERQTNAHGYLPILFGQPLEDGLSYQTKSLASNVAPIQDITTSMWNSVIAARKRAISDRGLYDPSRVSEAHINNPNPSAKIPVRPSAYGKPLSEAYYAIPFRDDQSGIIMQETQNLLQMANYISGQNQARQGQFVKGNKTRDEYQSVMANANGRDQLCAMLYEDQVFSPMKEIIKTNILQYQGGVSLYSRSREESITIDPLKLRKSVLEFKVSDGLTPAAKLINADAFQTSLQVLGSSPQIGSQYNLGPLFSYLIKTQGGDLRPFEKTAEQIAYEQAVAAWQQTTVEIAKAGGTQFPPQPTPEQFGYQPQGLGQSLPANSRETQATRVNNITNNITNTGEA